MFKNQPAARILLILLVLTLIAISCIGCGGDKGAGSKGISDSIGSLSERTSPANIQATATFGANQFHIQLTAIANQNR